MTRHDETNDPRPNTNPNRSPVRGANGGHGLSPDPRRQSLSEFLTAHRARLQPQSVGLPAGGRRRTPGLRREEVAQVAGVSTTWYTWLEQGRDISMSAQVLDRIAFALRLNEEERDYLFALALGPSAPAPAADKPPELPSSLGLILGELKYCPSIVSDRKCDIVGWNRAASAVFMDFEQVPPDERNLIWLLFTRKELRALAVNWEHFVSGFIAIFRYYYGKYVGDPWYGSFVERLGGRNEEFRAFWDRNDVSSAPELFIEFRHAKAGKMLFDLTSMQVQGRADLRCSVYTPSVGSDTETKMKRLMSRLGE
ncbi:helix-turn-helix transcriptional regulator [Paenibacillus flagellatus]|uniref:Transcriptional regulator n=1 Tax=Paenibacillus flagellatus TaxID=2211139 RepID=A0A2V5K290_9BACL|nr:helix-turn-helix transcriptional regulator [Paenibacillus flagellatus]PYI51884.1 transcriptional regulator [Paenibacillus flagellatus]